MNNQIKYTPVPISIQQVNIINSKHDKELLNTETNTVWIWSYDLMTRNKFKSLNSNYWSDPMIKKLSETEVFFSRCYQNLNYYITLLFKLFKEYEWGIAKITFK